MATVNKDFKIKSGLIVEGATGTINGYNILTEAQDSIDFIVNTIGGTATSTNTANAVVKRDANGDFAAGTISADLIGDVTGTVSDISNHSTTDLSEGSNLYFTDERAVTANTGLWDMSGSASAAEASAKSYADGLAVNYDPAGSASAAQDAAETYADGVALTAENNAKTYADSLAVNYDPAGSAASALADAQTYADTAVSNLIDAAPDLLNTLNEIAAALGDDPDFATTITTSISEKVAKAGDTMTGALTLSGAPTADLHAATKKYVDDAKAAAISTAETTATNLDIDLYSQVISDIGDAIAGEVVARNAAITTASNTINATIDALTTDDIAEGTNEYYTSVKAKTDAAALIVGATKTNIVITGDENGLTITAENGVADSTTDDLVEGSNNLYFTDQRAVDALEAVVPNFTEVDINSVATQVAATQNVAVASQVVGYSFDGGTYRSAKFLVKVSAGTHTEVSEVLVTLDTADNIAITEYAMVGTNGTLATVSAGMNGTDVELLVTTINSNSNVTVAGTLLV
jgi:hypothetical protein